MRILLSVVMVAAVAAGVAGQQPAAKPSVLAGRSRVATRYGIVATSQPLASQAGVPILEPGGNAVSAAIAANAVLALVEPHYNSHGGDRFAFCAAAVRGN